MVLCFGLPVSEYVPAQIQGGGHEVVFHGRRMRNAAYAVPAEQLTLPVRKGR